MSMIKNPDYDKYDYFVATIKTDRLEQITSYYKMFKWTMLESHDDRRYGDIEHITFYRQNKLANKDRLQYLQVCMEAELNNIGKYNMRKAIFKKGKERLAKLVSHANEKILSICDEVQALGGKFL